VPPNRKGEEMKTRAALLYEYKEPLVIDEISLEPPREKEVLIQYRAAGLCHTDLSVREGVLRNPPLPCVLGHEGAGIVQEVGPGVTRVSPGDHVLLMWVPVCGQCYYCLRSQYHLCVDRDKTRSGRMLDGTARLRKGDREVQSMLGVGSFSEYNVVSEQSVLPIDRNIPFDVAAVLGCAVVTGIGAVFNRARIPAGSRVAVVGVGGVGLNVVQGAALANATQIIAVDRLQNKLELARQLGATHLIDATREDAVARVKELTDGMGVDYAFEAIGRAETITMSYQFLRRGGTVVLVGIPDAEARFSLPLQEIVLLEKSILGCYYGSGDMRIGLKTLLDLYKSGRLKAEPMISRRYPLDEINLGLADLDSGRNVRGVILY
jgi:S-(hydroxymethyl)glutathione dehydrogenase/alcohol dehydrogenase